MSVNVGMIDRVLRALLGIGLIYWALTGGPVWAWVGVVALLTAAFGLCPLYSLLGLNTCAVKQR